MITRRQRLMARALHDELSTCRLRVTLGPNRDGTCYVRTVEDENPEWYRDFCAKHASTRKDLYRWRKHKTKIHRPSTLRALAHLKEGRMVSWYTEQLLAIVDKQLEESRRRLQAHVSDLVAPAPF